MWNCSCLINWMIRTNRLFSICSSWPSLGPLECSFPKSLKRLFRVISSILLREQSNSTLKESTRTPCPKTKKISTRYFSSTKGGTSGKTHPKSSPTPWSFKITPRLSSLDYIFKTQYHLKPRSNIFICLTSTVMQVFHSILWAKAHPERTLWCLNSCIPAVLKFTTRFYWPVRHRQTIKMVSWSWKSRFIRRNTVMRLKGSCIVRWRCFICAMLTCLWWRISLRWMSFCMSIWNTMDGTWARRVSFLSSRISYFVELWIHQWGFLKTYWNTSTQSPMWRHKTT